MHTTESADVAASIVRLVALHDPTTGRHLRATSDIAAAIAQALGLDAAAVETVALAGLLHDIGKVGVRREVLAKPDALTVEEWSEIRLHPQLGADVLAGFEPLAAVAPIVRAHHERIDGNGYPDRLRGEEIPIEARIIAVADAFDALTADRPYRRGVGTGDALAVIAKAAGTQFDVDVVAATLGVFAHDRHERRRSA